jgi:uncharacterized protein (DUF1015 family)
LQGKDEHSYFKKGDIMAEIRPFKGVRYNQKKVNIEQVITAPYDRISPERQEDYYKKSEYNIVRIILGKAFPNDTEKNSRYTRARDFFEKWVKEDILRSDESPALYPYYQEYLTPDNKKMVRKGFTALVKLEDYSKGVVLPHERTLSKPKEDRLNLLRATRVNFGQIFMLYPDSENKIANILENEIKNRAPAISVSELYEPDVVHKLWVMDNKEVISEVTELMQDKILLIADGHHRYETALNYSKENPEAKYRMVTMVSMDDPGLLILPTHRALYGIENKESFLEKAKEFFFIEDVKRDIFDKMKGEKYCFGLYIGNKYYLLRLKNEKLIDRFVGSEKTKEYKRLDVTVLHSILIENILGISREKVARKENIDYLRDPEQGIKGVNSRKYDLVFFMNPTRIDEVKAIAEKKETMPQKSTDFYPKMITGLVMNEAKPPK